MNVDGRILFPPFCLDIHEGCLWRGEAKISLRDMSFAVLRYLAERPGQLVTREELRMQVWEGRAVTRTVVTQGCSLRSVECWEHYNQGHSTRF